MLCRVVASVLIRVTVSPAPTKSNASVVPLIVRVAMRPRASSTKVASLAVPGASMPTRRSARS
jgi:hypothetical protein